MAAIQTLLDRAKEIQDQIERELAERRASIGYHIDKRRIVFSESLRQSHRAARVRLSTFLAATRPMVVLTAPVIYSLIVPFALLDLAVSLYQLICFPVYGIARVRRGDHIVIDRYHLAYLNGLQKLNCVYCGYCNGVISYVRDVAGATEQYWCPIKHARRVAGTHERYPRFADFGDADEYLASWSVLRAELGASEGKHGEE